ncbi:MAG: hypothetical protein FD138_1306 [Planctomycetota bacterium]|nr:MAG: hypothetical protein FD138_1306 [Planctomycetota bacterium]
MLLGSARIADAKLTGADLEAVTWLSVVFLVLPGILILLGLAVLGWTSRNRLKVCGQISAVLFGLALFKSLFDWFGK